MRESEEGSEVSLAARLFAPARQTTLSLLLARPSDTVPASSLTRHAAENISNLLREKRIKEMNKKIWWGLLILILLVLGIWLYSTGLESSKKVSEEKKGTKPEVFQKKEGKRAITFEKGMRVRVKKGVRPPKRKVVVPSNYEPVSPEVEGVEDFERERKREARRKDKGIPTG